MINLAEINRITLRVTFKPFAEAELRALGVQLPVPWEPTDEELGRLADTFAKALDALESEEAT
mgnify:CR=1 FL=1